jgi:hypothetical protein
VQDNEITPIIKLNRSAHLIMKVSILA